MIVTTCYPLALLLPFLYLFAIQLVSSHALPANRPSPPRRLPWLSPPPSLPSLSLPKQNAALTITQNIQALVNTLKADPSIEYSGSTMTMCEFAIEFFEHGDTPHDIYCSSNISQFRDTRCIFRYGSYLAVGQPSYFFIQNHFPEWDQWALPVPWEGPSLGPVGPHQPFAWSDVANHMSVERADRLLKAAGHEPGEGFIGQYEMVYLREKTTDGLAWCFENVFGDYPDTSAIHTYLVYVNTGRVEQTISC
ncbi:hypothetical protein XPA_010434 [Xanthoria parietina]